MSAEVTTRRVCAYDWAADPVAVVSDPLQVHRPAFSLCNFGRLRDPGYTRAVPPEAKQESRKLWKPHPDDEADVREAMESVDRGELLSIEASEAFLRWLEGGDDESWRDECG